MPELTDEESRNARVWEAVADLERDHYTREEIAESLRGVADELSDPVVLPGSVSSWTDKYWNNFSDYLDDSPLNRLVGATVRVEVGSPVEVVDHEIEP